MANQHRGIRIAALIAAAVSVTALSACSSSGGSSSPGASSPGATSDPGSSSMSTASTGAPSAPGSSATVSLPPAFAGKSSIDVAAVADYPPLSYADNGKIVGFNIDLLNEVARVLDTKFNYINTSYDDLIPSLKSGRVVIAEGGATDSTELEKHTIAVDYMTAGTQFIVPKGNPKNFSTPDTFCGATVAMLAGASDYIASVNSYSADCTKSGKAPIKQSDFKTADQALLALNSGRVDAEFDSSVLQAYRISQKAPIQTAGAVLNAYPISFQVLPNQRDLATALKDAINVLIQNGQYKSLLAKWHLDSSGLSAADVNNPSAK